MSIIKTWRNIYLTGDTHGDFRRVGVFCNQNNTTKEDLLIILGDSGINYAANWQDKDKKEMLEALDITLLAIHGNHEERACLLPDYQEVDWCGGRAYVEDAYPSLIFAKDGEIYHLNGKTAIAIGGAYSVDKMLRIAYGWRWYPSEQPSDEIKAYVESQLESIDYKVDVVLSHTSPLRYEPTEVFLSGIDQSQVDKSTEIWLDQIEKRLTYDSWYCGHFHTKKCVDRVRFLFDDYQRFPE